MEKEIHWWVEDLGAPLIRAGGLTGDKKRALSLTTERLCWDGRMEKRIGPLNKAEWARRTTRRLTAEFERIQKFLASPVSQQIEQDLMDTKRLIARLNEYPSTRVGIEQTNTFRVTQETG
jgi:hypothetical protein